MPETPLVHILLIEDNPGDARLIAEALRQTAGERFELEPADRLAAGLARLAAGEVEVVLLDLSLPDSHGLATVAAVRAQAPEVTIVVLTGLDDEALALQALDLGAQDYLVKGELDGRALTRAVRYAIERHRLQAELRSMVLSDPLTGLYNRRGFFALAEQQPKLAQRLGQTVLVFYVDVDHFKHINDTAGHAAGDQTLCATAALLRQTFRASDVIGRLGGDEFAVVALSAANPADDAILSRLRHNVEAYNAAHRGAPTLALSVGWVAYDPQQPATIEALVGRADAAMYANKLKRSSVFTGG